MSPPDAVGQSVPIVQDEVSMLGLSTTTTSTSQPKPADDLPPALAHSLGNVEPDCVADGDSALGPEVPGTFGLASLTPTPQDEGLDVDVRITNNTSIIHANT